MFEDTSFPLGPTGNRKIATLLEEITLLMKVDTNLKKKGQPFLHTNKTAVNTWKQLVKFSPNNIGNWSEPHNIPLHISAAIEKNLIQKLSHLFSDDEKLGGYITSGSTEGNLFSAWMGRNYLQNSVRKDEICLLSNSLSHYSIVKTADILGIDYKTILFDLRNWCFDINSLEKEILILSKKGYKGFLIPLTLGYTVGGTNDPIAQITKILDILGKKYKLRFYVWIDAAISGLVLSFLTPHYFPFHSKHVQAITFDFHKTLGVPYSSGCVLYRPSLVNDIRKPIPYLPVYDATLLGSRPGIAAVAVWLTLHRYGYKGFSKMFSKMVANKEAFFKEVRQRFKQVEYIVTDPYSLHGAMIVKEKLPESFCKQHGLTILEYPIGIGARVMKIKMYPVFFNTTF